MIVLQLILLVGSVVAFGACLCRLFMTSWRTTKAAIMVMHLALAVSVAWAAYHAWMQVGDMGDICSVIAALSWIIISYESWRHGVPEHFSKPMELDDLDLYNVRGRGRQ
jgi:hypothetical protein